ncbi:MAG: hypothetical protein NDF51_00410 [archaeon YNP-WB-040]|nr:hypothetical protein [Candidatus Culexarchaeum yellowstonense]
MLYMEQKDEWTDMSTPLIPCDDNLETLKFYIWSNGVKQSVEFTVSEDGKIDLYVERNRLHKIGNL